MRLLVCGAWQSSAEPGWHYQRIAGGLLVQDRDLALPDPAALKVVTRCKPSRHRH